MGSMKRVVSIYLIILLTVACAVYGYSNVNAVNVGKVDMGQRQERLSVADNERLEVRSLPLKPIVELEKGSAQRVDFSNLPYTLVLLMVWLPLLLFFMVCNRFHADKNNHFEQYTIFFMHAKDGEK